ncbi:unnamed protein product [Cuscuta europaea]|uniref:DUF3741 domain-containing protein n=1 Tax=Cuscuta europaea TaxID=41803 RepID=A0A9P1E248_CUSEU|nr:unnamed protein product [Cuscuta europaea]
MPSKNAAPGCISRMFRRLLCSDSIPKHPSPDHAVEKLKQTKPEEQWRRTGAVAKLMGLESMPPRTDFSSNCVARSRSMDSLREPNSREEILLKARSFREIPTYLELEDENFFILSFEHGGRKSAECGRVKNSPNRRRQSVYRKSSEIKNKTSEIIVGKDGEKVQEPTRGSTVQPHAREEVVRKRNKKKKEDCRKERFKRKMKEEKDCDLVDKMKVKADCDDTEKSSPNSVLDLVELAALQDTTPSSEKYSKLASLKSRRTLSEDLENHREPKSGSDDFKPQQSNKVYSQTKKDICKDENYVELWGEICKLTGKDTVHNEWAVDKKEACKYEICASLEFEIVDELVKEMVEQLYIDSKTTFICNSKT